MLLLIFLFIFEDYDPAMKPEKENIPHDHHPPNTNDPGYPEESVFSLLVNSIQDYAIFIIDEFGYIQSWNKGARDIKWYTEEEIIGKNISLFYTDDDINASVPNKNLQQARKLGSYESEGWRKRKGGSLFWASVTFTALYNNQGVFTGFAKITRDTTMQKRAEAKIAYLARMVDKTSDAIFSLSSTFNVLSWNRAAQALYGFTPEEVLLKPAEQVLGADITDEYRQEARAELNTRGFWNGEICHTKKDGTPFWVFLSVTLSRDEKGRADEYICISRDITAQKKAEEEKHQLYLRIEKLATERLKESLKEIADYKYALNRSSIVAITNADGIITYVNENFCRISQYSSEEVIGQDHRILNSGYHPAAFMRELWETIESGNVWKGEIRNKRKDGTFYWVDATIVPFINDEGKPYQYLSIRTDITERKNAEQELHSLNEQLEERVKNRTQQLELVNKELEAFSYSVSHDLRAPLRAVSGYSKIVLEDYSNKIDSEGKRLLNNIVGNAKMMGQLIDDLLSFSRLGRKEIAMVDIDMQGLVRGCLQQVLDNTTGKYVVEVEPLVNCTGDVNMIKQVWVNYIGNAVKYSANNTSPQILIGSRLENDMIIYYIKDNGVGFDMNYAHKLFGVFQRLHRADEFEGTGVGLALVKRIIAKHNGEVWAGSELGKGATFYFSLPQKIVL